jgi:hypothetical protein
MVKIISKIISKMEYGMSDYMSRWRTMHLHANMTATLRVISNIKKTGCFASLFD